MFDPDKLRALADRAAALQTEARAVREEINAMLLLAVSGEPRTVVDAWPRADRECRQHMLHAIINLGKAGTCLGIAIDDLGNAAIGVQI